MADPQILSLKGVEVQLEVWRGTVNVLRATLKQINNQPLPLTNYDVSLTVVDRPSGVVKFNQTNEPDDHLNAAQGQTEFGVAPDYDGVTELRPLTWKYQVVSRERTTGQHHVHFYGDFRVIMPPVPIAILIVGAAPRAAVHVSDAVQAILV